MESENIVLSWFQRNWPLVTIGVVLAVGVGVLLMRSAEYTSPPTAEAAVVVVPGETVVFPGRATIVVPGDNGGTAAALVSDTRVVD